MRILTLLIPARMPPYSMSLPKQTAITVEMMVSLTKTVPQLSSGRKFPKDLTGEINTTEPGNQRHASPLLHVVHFGVPISLLGRLRCCHSSCASCLLCGYICNPERFHLWHSIAQTRLVQDDAIFLCVPQQIQASATE